MYKMYVIYFTVRLKDKKEMSEAHLLQVCHHFVGHPI